MGKKSAVAHIVYGLMLVLLGVAVAASFRASGINGLWAASAAELLLIIPFSLLLAARVGPLRVSGVALAAAAVVLGTQLLTVEIYDYLAGPAGGGARLGDLYANGHAPMLLRGAAITIVGSVAWLLILRRKVRSMASNNSSKPTPLRGAA